MTLEKKKKRWEDYDQKTAKLTPEEQEMRKENLEARGRMNDDGTRQLCAAVCLGAIYDYKKAKKKLAPFMAVWGDKSWNVVPKPIKKKIEEVEEEIRELEDFFESDMFTMFSATSDREQAVRMIDRIPSSYMTLLERRHS